MPVPVITVAQMREWEKATWASGQSEETVMRRAGQAIARRAEELTQPGEVILVLAGKGHNGDDARFAAEHIAGREVVQLRVVDPEATVQELKSQVQRRPALVIDGLFGIGLNRSLGTPWLKLIERLNETGLPVLAVDVPSGLNADTGLPLETAVRSVLTVTLGAVKEGLLSPHAWPFVGRLEVAPDIGLIPYPFTTEFSYGAADDFWGYPPRRPQEGHKGSFGHVAIVAGSLGYHGAAVLAARGAQRAQPGLITVLTAEATYLPVAAQLQAVMVRPWAALELPENCTAILAGPGLASPEVPDAVRQAVATWWQSSPLPMVVDASALAWLPEGPCPDRALRLMTPHPGEAARLLHLTSREVQSNRPKALRELSRRYGRAYVLLKGHQSLTGRDKERVFVNSSGNPYLAQGGSGDVLAGYVAGLLAQPPLQAEPGKLLRYAVWQHGAAADALAAGQSNFMVEDLIIVLGSIPSPRPRFE